MDAGEVTIGVVVSAILAVIFKAIVAATGHSIEYWIAFLVCLVFVFIGWIVFDSDWID